MNSFESYGFLGTYFITFAFWYIIQISRRHHICRCRGLKYSSNTFYTCDFLSSHWRNHPLEAFAKIAILIAGITLEIVQAARDNWDTSGLKHAKFSTIYFFMALSAGVDIASHYLSATASNLDYLCCLFSFFAEWVLFRFPKGEKTPLEELLFKLVEYVVLFTMAAVVFEAQWRSYVIPALIRAYLMLLQGTWLWQCGFILWKPSFGLPWKHEDEGDQILACLFFTWHCAGNLVLVVAMSMIIALLYRGKGILQRKNKDEIQMKSLIKPRKNGKTIISLGSYDDDEDDDDESEVEFQQRRQGLP